MYKAQEKLRYISTVLFLLAFHKIHQDGAHALILLRLGSGQWRVSRNDSVSVLG